MPDPVLPGFESATLTFPADYEGPVAATLVRRRRDGPVRPGRAVLYVHGFVDYFFQAHLAEQYAERGFAFYALDLRKYGRSLLPGQHPNFCKDVAEYYADLTAAIDVVRREEGEPFLLVNGHSTGGLVTALYAAEGERRDCVGALFLNSPFFAFNASALQRPLIPALAALGRWLPFVPVPGVFTPAYGESIHRAHRGEWDFDERWKPTAGFPVYLGWLRAIHQAHQKVRRGLGLRVPALVMHSDKSVVRRRWHPSLTTSDGVLNVDHIRRYGPVLGSRVSVVEVPGGVHDLVLSREDVRGAMFARLFEWLDRVAADMRPPERGTYAGSPPATT